MTRLRLALLCVSLSACSVAPSYAATNRSAGNNKTASVLSIRNTNWAAPVDVNGGLNLYRVTPTFYRSAQFSKAQLTELEHLGIHTSIDLRQFHSDSVELTGSSIQQVRIPIYTWRITDKAVIAALVAIQQAETTGPVLVHCQHGADRTGLITAMYRIVYQGWTKDAALDELLYGGYGYHHIWRNIPKYIRNVDASKIKSAVDAELASQHSLKATPQQSAQALP